MLNQVSLCVKRGVAFVRNVFCFKAAEHQPERLKKPYKIGTVYLGGKNENIKLRYEGKIKGFDMWKPV